MLNPTAICDQYAWLYQTKIPEPPGTWDAIVPEDGAYSAVKVVDGTAYVMFRGSLTFLDWMQDFQDFALPFEDADLGPVHPGFRAGALLSKRALDIFVGDSPVVIVGHSLGAGHAALYAGYRVAQGQRVDGLVMFGEPKPGGPKLSSILANVSVQSFRNANANGHDLVTDVPFTDAPYLPYQHVRTLTDCRRDPNPLDAWLVFKFHHFRLYAEAFGAAGPAVLALPDGGLGA